MWGPKRYKFLLCMAFPEPYPIDHWPKSPSDCLGWEFDWYCLDRRGFVAVLTTAGRGHISESFFQTSVHEYNVIITALVSRETCKAVRVTAESGNFSDWQFYAQHGLFAFDFQDVHRTSARARNGYDLIYKPVRAVHQSELPESARCCLPIVETDFSLIDFLPLSLLSRLWERLLELFGTSK